MTEEQFLIRQEIRFASQNCEEIGLGDNPLTERELDELEEQATRLVAAIAAYRAAFQPSEI